MRRALPVPQRVMAVVLSALFVLCPLAAYAAGEEYFPQEMAQTRYYHPTNRGLEGKIGEKLTWLAGQDQNSPIKRYR